MSGFAILFLTPLLLLAALAAAPFAYREAERRRQLGSLLMQLQGEWEKLFPRNGVLAPFPTKCPPVMTIRGDTVTFIDQGKSVTATFRVVPGDPPGLDIDCEPLFGSQKLAVFKVEGDILNVTFSEVHWFTKPETRPTSIRTKPGSGVSFFRRR